MAADTPALSPATVVVHAGRPPHDVDQPLNAPITMASTYVAGGDREYGRTGNPTWQAFDRSPDPDTVTPGRTTRLAVIGHSLGALAVSYLQGVDDRIQTVVALDKLSTRASSTPPAPGHRPRRRTRTARRRPATTGGRRPASTRW